MKPKVNIRNGIFGANDVSIKDVEYPNEPAIATKRLPNLFTKWGNMGPEKYLNTNETFSKNDANMLCENYREVTHGSRSSSRSRSVSSIVSYRQTMFAPCLDIFLIFKSNYQTTNL